MADFAVLMEADDAVVIRGREVAWSERICRVVNARLHKMLALLECLPVKVGKV